MASLFLIGYLSGLLSAFVGFHFLLRRYTSLKSLQSQDYESQLMRKKEEIRKAYSDLQEKTEALRKIIGRVYHRGIIPRAASILGLCNVLRPSLKELMSNIEMARRPNHHRYADLAIGNTKDFEQCVDGLSKMAGALHSEIHDAVKEFEHLQE